MEKEIHESIQHEKLKQPEIDFTYEPEEINVSDDLQDEQVEVEVEKKKTKKQRRRLLTIGIGVVFLVMVIIYVIVSRKKPQEYIYLNQDVVFYNTGIVDGEHKGFVYTGEGNIVTTDEINFVFGETNLLKTTTLLKSDEDKCFYVITKDGASLAFLSSASEYEISTDGNYIYYVQYDISSDVLYCYNVKKKETIEIIKAKRIDDICVSPDGEYVTANITDGDQARCTYYFHDGEKQLLGEGWDVFAVSSKGKYIFYKNIGSNMMYRYDFKNTEELGDDGYTTKVKLMNYDQTELMYSTPEATYYAGEGLSVRLLGEFTVVSVILPNISIWEDQGDYIQYGINSFKEKVLEIEQNNLVYFKDYSHIPVIYESSHGNFGAYVIEQGNNLLIGDYQEARLHLIVDYSEDDKKRSILWNNLAPIVFCPSNEIYACNKNSDLFRIDDNYQTLWQLNFQNWTYYCDYFASSLYIKDGEGKIYYLHGDEMTELTDMYQASLFYRAGRIFASIEEENEVKWYLLDGNQAIYKMTLTLEE